MGYSYCLTKAGYALQAKLFAEGGDLHITRVSVGSGVLPAGTDPAELTQLLQVRAAATSSEPVRTGCAVDLDIEYRSDLNGELEDAFQINEFGLFAIGAEGEEALILYGDLSDYPETAVPQKYGGCVRRYPVHVEIGARTGVVLDYPAGAWATVQDIKNMLAAHNADPSAHNHFCRVLAVREREAGKPDYGLGEETPAEPVLLLSAYTGDAPVAAVVSGTQYDARNMSVGEDVPDGTLILREARG